MELKDDAVLLAAMRKAVERKVSAAEIQQQRVSFIFSSVKQSTGITKAKINDMLAGNSAAA